MKKILFILGTRPEAIKLAPVIVAMRSMAEFEVRVCATGQHEEMLGGALTFFGIKEDVNLHVMKKDQTLFDITTSILQKMHAILTEFSPDGIVVQGDTTSAFVGALSGFYTKIKVIHIEAGLRSGDRTSPFPEEGNRLLISKLADYHLAPTSLAVEALSREGIAQGVYLVGNTVVDALNLSLDRIQCQGDAMYEEFYSGINFSHRIILITGHRRENHGEALMNICTALRDIVDTYPDVSVVYPVHLNPRVQEVVQKVLQGHERIHLFPPIEYPFLVWIMSRSYIIVTDSGGIQEEAPSLGKPVLVTRSSTERTEGIDAGVALLIGTDKDRVYKAVQRFLTDHVFYQSFVKGSNPYGDGLTTQKIISILKGI